MLTKLDYLSIQGYKKQILKEENESGLLSENNIKPQK